MSLQAGSASLRDLVTTRGKTGLPVNLLMEKLGLLVCLGCYNRIPQTGWFIKKQTFISHGYETWEVQEDLVSPEDSLLSS